VCLFWQLLLFPLEFVLWCAVAVVGIVMWGFASDD